MLFNEAISSTMTK